MAPTLTVLNFSGGKQSSCLLWMVLKGDIPRPENFLVLNADPGMENSVTYRYVAKMRALCVEAGIPFATAPGPNLHLDLVQLKLTKAKRIDSPPYWTLSKKGKVGQLMQKCTRYYKVEPMDRFLRKYLEANYGISAISRRIGVGTVEKWIGFSADEAHRVKPSRQKYISFAYPLIDRDLTNDDVLAYFKSIGEKPPPRSVCNACFANGSDVLTDMKLTRPADWAQACEVDESVRDMSGVGVNDTVFVSRSCKPLKDFEPDSSSNGDDWACDSGYCFV